MISNFPVLMGNLFQAWEKKKLVEQDPSGKAGTAPCAVYNGGGKGGGGQNKVAQWVETKKRDKTTN